MFSEPAGLDDSDWAHEGDDPLAAVGEPQDLTGTDQPDDEGPLEEDAYPHAGSDPGEVETVLLIWPQPEFELVDQHWPEVLEPLGADSWEDYRRYYEARIRRWTSQGRHVSMVVGSADGFAGWLSDQGADPISVDLVAMAHAYGGHLSEQTGAVELPPGAADPCWCGSGVSYQRCCRRLLPG